ncbi:MAG: ribosome assembly cofactor RimP [Bacteroidaceae bacterium]|nr:ribosome assembly cofactor RimP [Bacteroidaceae bacterium]
MIDKKAVEKVVNEWLDQTEYFLVDLAVTPDDRVQVTIDHPEGVWIEDCAELSRHIEAHFDREEEDYELEVGSAGLGQPFRVRQQWEMNIGNPVETQLKDGKKLQGELTAVCDETFTITSEQKVKHEGEKRPRKEMVATELRYDEVVYTKYLIKMK